MLKSIRKIIKKGKLAIIPMVTFSMVLSVMSPYVHAEEPYSAISGEIIEEVQEENLQDEEIGTLNVNEGEDLSLSGEEDEERILVSSFSQDYTIPGNENPDEMLNAYIEKRIDKLQNPVYMASDFAGNNLEGANRVFYNLIKRKITGIVYGGDTEVFVRISYSDLGLEKKYYSAAELGVDQIKANDYLTEEAEEAILHKYGFDSLDLESVMTAVKADCPLETFWMGLDVNFGYSYSIGFGDTVEIGLDQIGVCLSINSSYRNSDGAFDSRKMQRIQTAIMNIDDILDTAKNKNDRDKMDYYRDKICQLTEYNHPAAQWDKSMYGDPWQLIYVFDGDESTNVVCEGYSKAFKLLCSHTAFASQNINCYIVTGDFESGNTYGKHMWNVVHWNDGINYLVDITNYDSTRMEVFYFCDSSQVTELNPGVAYRLNFQNSTFTYSYDEDTLSVYDPADLCISDSSQNHVSDNISISYDMNVYAEMPTEFHVAKNGSGTDVQINLVSVKEGNNEYTGSELIQRYNYESDTTGEIKITFPTTGTYELKFEVNPDNLQYKTITVNVLNARKCKVTFLQEEGNYTDIFAEKEVIMNHQYGDLPVIPNIYGFSLMGWKDENGHEITGSDICTGDIVLIPIWLNFYPTVEYKVMHYTQKLDGTYVKYPDDTETFSADIGTTVTPSVKSYTGFKAPSAENVQIKSNEPTYIRYYYERNSYTLTWDLDGGEIRGSDYTSGSMKYEELISQPYVVKEGYTFDGWDKEVPFGMPAENLTIKAKWKPKDDTVYVVEHYKQKLDGKYKTNPDDIDYFTGTTDQKVTPDVNSYTGFGVPAAKTAKIKGDGSTVVKYLYPRNSYTLTWDFDGGSASGEYTTGKVKYQQAITAPVPVKKGYTFDGWSVSVPSKMPAKNITVKAVWKANYATVTFNVNGGKALAEKTIAVQEFTAFGDLPTTTRTGYTFTGWYTAKSGGTKVTAETVCEGDITLYAHWKAKTNTKYTVEHYKQKLDGTYPAKPGETGLFTGTTNTSVTPEVKTYKGFTSPVTKTEKIKADGSLVIQYYYERNSYKLTWDFDGGSASGKYTKGSVKYGASIKAPVPTKKGYTFNGWSVEVPAKMPAKNLKVKALWTENYATVTFNVNGGKALAEKTKAVQEFTAYGELPTTTRTGYTFTGWYTAKSGGTKVTAETVCEGDITLYAHWKAKTNTKYTVEHYKQKLDGTYNAKASETESLTGTTNTKVTPAVKEYKGFTAPELQTVKISADGTLVVKYYYTRNSYKLTWDFAGGSAKGSYTKGTVKYGTKITAPVPTRDGYVFTGWDKTVASTMPAGDVTYKAKWRKPTSEEQVRNFVERFYTIILERPAEAEGLNDWTNRLIGKTATGAEVAAGFINSGEFQNKKMTDEEYVTKLYRAFFDREPDKDGYNGWLRELKNGKTRDDVLRGFINSPEFNNLCKKYGINAGSY